MVKIVHLNAFEGSDGTARAVYRLHRAMQRNGFDSRMVVQQADTKEDPTIRIISLLDEKFFSIVRRFLSVMVRGKYKKDLGMFSCINFGADVSRIPEVWQADIIYIHMVTFGYLNFHSLERILKLGKPVYWFMHDMFSITGGCHHAFDCTKYQMECYGCQYFFTGKKRDIAYRQFRKKAKNFSRYPNLSFVTPSKWEYECTKKSALARNHKVFYIPNLIDTGLYKPFNKGFSREIFGIEADKKIILFGATASITNPYKGWSFFKESLENLSHDVDSLNDINVVIFGCDYQTKIADSIPFKTVFLGKLHDNHTLCLAYNAADVFVVSSLAESFGQTILESLSCGTPVVGFNVGGIPDMVSDKTGYLAEYKNSNDLARGIKKVLFENILFPEMKSIVSFFDQDNVAAMHEKMWDAKA
jgi:glycosyltransferase involved in cell wall biosynthesis